MSGEKKKLCELPGPSQGRPRGAAVLPSPGTMIEMEKAIPSHLMPPPLPPPPKVGRPRSSALKKRAILEEEEYVASLESIISRDFFPDIPRLKGQLRWLHSVSPADAELARRIIMYGKGIQERGSKAAALKEALEDYEEWAQMEWKQVTNNSVVGDSERRSTMSLSEFLASHSSEDNETFQQLLEDMQAEHRRRYWWAYEETGGEARLLLLPSGERNEGSRKRRLLAALSPDSPHGDKEKDDRPIVPRMWKHQTRNALMFQPDLRSSRETCGVDPDNPPLLAIKDGISNQRVGRVPSQARGIQHSATRVPSESGSSKVASNLSEIGASLLEPPGSDRSSVMAIDQLEGVDKSHQLNRLVPMTPTIIPGAGGESPLMTWGEIQGTPLVLNTPSFQIRNQPQREQVAHRLQQSRRWRGTGTGTNGSKPTPMPRSRTMEGSQRRTPQHLTPAAKNLARKLAGSGGGASTPFGGGLSHRSTKQQGGVRKTKQSGMDTPRLLSSTPQMPVREKNAATPLHKPHRSSTDGGDDSKKKSSLTDNLLKL